MSSIDVWDSADRKRRCLLRGIHRKGVSQLGFSPDGSKLASVHRLCFALNQVPANAKLKALTFAIRLSSRHAHTPKARTSGVHTA